MPFSRRNPSNSQVSAGAHAWGARGLPPINLERLENRQLLSGNVTRLMLVNADTDRDLFPITDGVVLNLSTLPTRNITVRADVAGGKTRSVRFSLDSAVHYALEKHAPYAIAGDTRGGKDLRPWKAPLGAHTLTATPFLWDNGRGPAGQKMTVRFRLIVVAPPTVPAAPGGLHVASASEAQVQLGWSDVNGESGYLVRRSVDGVQFETIGKVQADVTGYLDTAISGGMTYHYQVWSYNDAGHSSSTAVVSATTPVKTLPPSAPLSLTAAAALGQVALTWLDTAGDEDGIRVLRSIDGGAFAAIASLPADTISFVDEEVVPATGYTYRVIAFNSAGDSDVAEAQTQTPVELAAPAAATDFVAMSHSVSEVELFWTDNAEDEGAFRVYRSENGLSYEEIAVLPADSTSYTDTLVSKGVKYWYRVAAVNPGGETYSDVDDAIPTAQIKPRSTSGAILPSVPGVLQGPPQSVVDFAIQQPLIRYHRAIAGGAHTNQPGTGESAITLALASFTGNTTADVRLLQQILYTINDPAVTSGTNDFTSNGGYPAQHERHLQSAFTLAKMTPRIWNALTDVQRKKIDLLMKATLVASAFTTADNNPYVKTGTQQRALDADTNMNRGWNPNYREGMIGAILVNIVYFGGPENVSKILETYDHQRFTAELKEYGLMNAHETFNWKNANPASIAPDGPTIESAIKDYRYLGSPLTDYIGIYDKLASVTFEKRVVSGVNNGLGVDTDGDGIGDAGMIYAGAENLPNRGLIGMLGEFDSIDANGPRSSAQYSYDGWRIHLKNHLVLVAGGYWQAQTEIATRALTRMSIGSIDLWYKLDNGYINYQKGSAKTVQYSTNPNYNFELTGPMWSVLKAYHGIV